MSLMEHGGGAHNRPVTAVAWASNSSTCPKDFNLISITEDGAAANFTRSFAMKAGYYLCYSKDMSGGMVVSDVQVISDKETVPHGYCYIPEHLEPRASVSKKKRVCVRMVPVGSVETAVLDIKLTAKTRRMLQHYTCLGNAPPMPPGRKLSHRRSNLQLNDAVDKVVDCSNIYGISAIDGVPFTLHPKFKTQTNGTTPTNTLNNIRIKSVQDIENEYNYTFTVEENAAKRTTPLTTGSTS
uniref:multivesicular body subunit 12A isoform X3 n=1 Tax=Oncorhynchus gorbuscha TaxID=8017 RepID=UPI001EAED735|nr:multivesicular body subunit 12A isoform X3 [Oncorhynchus gorbuscha]